MSVNFVLGDFVSQWRVARISRLKFATLHVNASCVLPMVNILYKNGIIRSYAYSDKGIVIYFKYYNVDINTRSSYKLTIISTPGNRVYWTLKELSNYWNQHNVRSFYILSTKYGLKTNIDCLFYSRIGGEVLLKIEV